MRLQRLLLDRFRNYASADLDLSEGMLHLFIGENGSGKTNLLEAVSILSLTQSCRGAQEQDLPSHGSPYYRIRGQAASDTAEEVRLEVVGEVEPRRRRGCFRNDVRIGVSAMVGQLPSVTFLPEDMRLFSGPPAERRRFVDQLLSQVSPEYLAALSEYQRALKQRNVLLKSVVAGRASPAEIDLWDRTLAIPAAFVTVARLELFQTLNLSLCGEMQALGEPVTSALLAYERKGEQCDRASLEAEIIMLLQAARERDLIVETTSVGPHRDDWRMLTDGRSVAAFASRGQQRVCMLALLFLQVSYLQVRKGETPVVLLDDVFSELDDAHQSLLVSALGSCQVLLTGTHLPPLLTGAALWRVEDGIAARVEARDLPGRATLASHG